MENSLRLGIFRDRPVFEEMLSARNPIVVPAHIAAYARDGLWGFLRGLAKAQASSAPEFFYDPMSYWLDVPTEFWSKGSDTGRGEPLALPIDEVERIRPAFLALLRAYGMEEAVKSVASEAALRAAFIAGGVGPCLAFQRGGSAPKGEQAVNKYARILDLPLEGNSMHPRHLVAPYLAISELTRVGVADQAALNSAALTDRQDEESLWAVLAVDARSRTGALSDELRRDLMFDSFEGVGIWVSEMDEHDSTIAALSNYRTLIASVRRPVWVMYGGYFALLLGPEGVVNVSHGIYYTESKRMRGPVGSGPAPERYYIPALHRFYNPGQAFRFLGLVPSLQCDCPECRLDLNDLIRQSATASSSPAARMEWIKRLQRHFLYAREREVADVSASARPDLVATLRATATTVNNMAPSQRAALGISADHLTKWAEVLIPTKLQA